MADEDITTGTEAEPPRKKGGPPKIIIVIAVLLVVLAGGAAFVDWKYTHFVLGKDKKDAAQGEKAEANATKPGQEADGVRKPLPIFLVNLSDPLGRRYLKLGLEVELRDLQVQQEMEKSEAKVKDAILLLLSSKSYDQISTLESKIELKQEIVNRMNQVLGQGKVLRVYITEMVVQ